jgi:ubiquinone/menaquinone biosynthesis C-methylase UbiE
MTKKNVDDKLPIYKLKTAKEILGYYRNWTENNKYNQDMVDMNYTAPKETVSILIKYVFQKDIKILDAGCGTGLVGIELKKHNYSNIDGVDFSQNMLDLVPKDIYKNLSKFDLNKPLKYKNNTYDVVICVGTFTYGHVKAHALDEFIRIIKKKGLICFTINEGIYEKYGFDKKIKELTDNKSLDVKEFFKSDYITTKDVNAWLCLAEINN